MIWILVGILVVLILFVSILLCLSPGKLKPFRDREGNVIPDSISELTMIEINGLQQGLILQSKHQQNPVLLFLHGGPGLPEYFLSLNSGLRLEENFTVCWWEQRGSGRSYRPDIPPETMTLEQMIKDTLAVTNYLRERFGREKIYLMGHSWGSFLGMHVISRHPELYHAYFGIGQVANQFESERRAYRFMLDEACRRGEKNTEKALLKYDIPSAQSIDMSYIKGIRSSTMDRFGAGFMREVSTFKDEIIPLLTCRAYTLQQKSATVKGMMFSLDHLFNLTSKYALSERLPKVEIPVFFSQGLYDKQTSYELAKEYYDLLDAPIKRFHTFEKSAHSPQFEEPELFQSLLLEDIQYVKTAKK